MAIHIVGINGVIGNAIKQYAPENGLHWERDIYGYSSPQISLLTGNDDSFRALKLSPGDIVINCVGYTAVDMAESDTQKCYQLNAYGPANLAQYVYAHACHFISLSSDYVFSPQLSAIELSHTHPWRPTDPTHAQCVYGASKILGEQLISTAHPTAVIVRTSWIYATPQDNNSPLRHDFVSLLAHKAKEGASMSIVGDQIGSPTWTRDIAFALIHLAQAYPAVTPVSSTACAGEGQILHYAGKGECSWYELAQEIYRLLEAPIELIQEISSDALGRAAQRPQYSALDVSDWDNLDIYPTRPWKAALALALSHF